MSTTQKACILLPLYGVPAEGGVRSVNLFSFTATAGSLYWLFLIALVASGAAQLCLLHAGRPVWTERAGMASLLVSAAAILFFAAVKEPYATALLFLLFAGKLFLRLKQEKLL